MFLAVTRNSKISTPHMSENIAAGDGELEGIISVGTEVATSDSVGTSGFGEKAETID